MTGALCHETDISIVFFTEPDGCYRGAIPTVHDGVLRDFEHNSPLQCKEFCRGMGHQLALLGGGITTNCLCL